MDACGTNTYLLESYLFTAIKGRSFLFSSNEAGTRRILTLETDWHVACRRTWASVFYKQKHQLQSLLWIRMDYQRWRGEEGQGVNYHPIFFRAHNYEANSVRIYFSASACGVTRYRNFDLYSLVVSFERNTTGTSQMRPRIFPLMFPW